MVSIREVLGSGGKEKEINCFKLNSHIFLLFKIKSRKYLFSSTDGFDFNKDVLTKSIEKVSQDKENFSKFTPILAPGSEYVPPHLITVEGQITTKKDKLLFYHFFINNNYQVGVAGLDKDDKIIWRHHQPVWLSPPSWQKYQVSFLNVLKIKNKIISYWHLKNNAIYAIVYPEYKINNQIEIKRSNFLHKPANNPLIAPNPNNSWEAFTTFNPAAIYEADKVHILYRAQGFDYQSVLGYAVSNDGFKIDYKQNFPCYIPTQPFEKGSSKSFNICFTSGGGCEGCEDPRITKIDNRIYMTYVAFNGWDPPRIAITSIALTDFLAHRWLWERPVLISPPRIVDKSACILPEKIGGKYVIFHRIFPNILIDFVDSLDFKPGQYLTGQYKITPRSPLWWDSRKIGTASPPLKTKDGWLLIYQSVDDKDSGHYLVGAMLLKLNDPTQILYRSAYPIIEPDMWYDNQGFKAGVVYPCGAVIINDTLFVYYGGADSHVCVATANLDQFLENLKNNGSDKLTPTLIKKI